MTTPLKAPQVSNMGENCSSGGEATLKFPRCHVFQVRLSWEPSCEKNGCGVMSLSSV